MYEKVLLVDDEKDIVSLIKDALTDENYEVIPAYNSEEALTKLNLKPDIILLDVMMPGTDGYEFCRSIRNSIRCPIIFLTAKSEDQDIIKGLSIGGDDYITKPFSIKALRARIAAHLRREHRSTDVSVKNLLNFQGLSLDLNARKIEYRGIEFSLTKKRI